MFPGGRSIHIPSEPHKTQGSGPIDRISASVSLSGHQRNRAERAGSARSIVRSAGQDRQDAEREGDHSEHEADAATRTALSF